MRTFGFRRLSLAHVAAAILVAGVSLFRCHYQLTMVVGNSMLPTLHQADLLIVDKFAYEQDQPQRGDIVVARYGADFIVKRIVGLPGEEVEVRKGVLYINGAVEKESYSVVQGPLDVSAGRLFEGDFATLGDNRAMPDRLAIHPIISMEDIVGKVLLKKRTRVGAPNDSVHESLVLN